MPIRRAYIFTAAGFTTAAAQFPVFHSDDIISGNVVKPSFSSNNGLNQELCSTPCRDLSRTGCRPGLIIQNHQPTIDQLINPVRARGKLCWPLRPIDLYAAINFRVASHNCSATAGFSFNKPSSNGFKARPPEQPHIWKLQMWFKNTSANRTKLIKRIFRERACRMRLEKFGKGRMHQIATQGCIHRPIDFIKLP